MNLKGFFSTLMIGVLLSSVLPINVLADTSGIINNMSEEDVTTSGSAISISDSNIDVDFIITGQWSGGFNGEITITNLTDTVIENWQIQMEFPQEITNIWNATIVSHDGAIYNIKNTGGNNSINIHSGESVAFGFTATFNKEIISPQNISLVAGKTDADNESYSVEYTLLSDWGSGYSAQITITNNTDKPMKAWHLTFDFDREIESIWNAIIKEHTGNTYCVSNAEYNSVIPANGSVSFGFNGNGGLSENEPKNYKLLHTGNLTETSNPDTEEDIDYEKDTDGDMLPDWLEEIIETDINKPDTDDDGLSDYDELALTGTNPLKYDTDDNGICDIDEDADGDGLTNGEEITLGTNPSDADTDSDGLTDYDELYAYNTDPLKYDTDGDGLPDGDEILLGLDPNKTDTDNDGVQDCDEKIRQSLKNEIQCEELKGITEVEVTIDVSGSIENFMDIENMYNKNMLSTDLVGIKGAPMDISCSQEFDTAEISFTYDEALLDTEPENLGILWYNEAEQFYEVMDTTLDRENHKIVMTTPHFSEYTVVDLNMWRKAWERKFDYLPENAVQKNSSWNGLILTPQQLYKELGEHFGTENTEELNDVLKLLEQDVLYARIIDYFIELNDGSEFMCSSLFVSDKEFYRVDGRDEDWYPGPCTGGWTFLYTYDNLADGVVKWPKRGDVKTGCGVGHNIYETILLYDGKTDITDNDNDGLYDIYETTGMRIANGQVIYTKVNNSDTDGDSLKDGEEITKYNADKGYFLLSSNPTAVDSDNDKLSDDKDPEPYKHFDKRFMLVDSFDYVPSVEFVDRHYEKGQECYFKRLATPADAAKWTALSGVLNAAYITPWVQFTIDRISADNMGIDNYEEISAVNFSKMLSHYLGNTGNIYYLDNDDMAGIIYSQKNNYEHMVYNVQQFKSAAEEIVVNDGEAYISTSGGNDFKVACYKAINCQNHIAGKGYDDSLAANWGYAIGEALGGMTGKVSLNNGVYHAKIKYYLIDTYEFPVHWDSNLKDDDFNIWAHDLHECGLAKEYKIIGEYSINISWEKGTQEVDYTPIRLSGDYLDETYYS